MRAGIALGSNIEPRFLHLQTAHRHLLVLHQKSELILCSKVYETPPVNCPKGTKFFLNAVLEISTNLSPHDLLSRLQDIEQSMGRPRVREKNSPRIIDLDLLYCDNLTYNNSNLTLPHPRLSERRFVLQPLADVRPDMILPGFTKSVQELLVDLAKDEKIKIFNNTIN